MALSLGWHIILASFGVGFPAMIFVAHWRGLVRKNPVALGLAQRWAKASAVLFAIGAVSGTVLSFEMGLLWPGLMGRFGDVLGLAFALEGHPPESHEERRPRSYIASDPTPGHVALTPTAEPKTQGSARAAMVPWIRIPALSRQLTRRSNGRTEDSPVRRAGWSHDWQSRWSHEGGRKPATPVPCLWRATPP
ncbi:MAG: cytochrome ubiquinol oxidase subunit I, partial [Lacisediminihabitans sp.]